VAYFFFLLLNPSITTAELPLQSGQKASPFSFVGRGLKNNLVQKGFKRSAAIGY